MGEENFKITLDNGSEVTLEEWVEAIHKRVLNLEYQIKEKADIKEIYVWRN